MPTFTVFAIYASTLQRYATTVEAPDAQSAEQRVRAQVMEESGEELLVAAVAAGEISCLDAGYADYACAVGEVGEADGIGVADGVGEVGVSSDQR